MERERFMAHDITISSFPLKPSKKKNNKSFDILRKLAEYLRQFGFRLFSLSSNTYAEISRSFDSARSQISGIVSIYPLVGTYVQSLRSEFMKILREFLLQNPTYSNLPIPTVSDAKQNQNQKKPKENLKNQNNNQNQN